MFLKCHTYFLSCFLCYQEPNSLGRHSGHFSLHLSHQGIQFDIQTSRDRRIRWCNLSTIPDTTTHCWVNTEGNVDSLGSRRLVYLVMYLHVHTSRLTEPDRQQGVCTCKHACSHEPPTWQLAGELTLSTKNKWVIGDDETFQGPCFQGT